MPVQTRDLVELEQRARSISAKLDALPSVIGTSIDPVDDAEGPRVMCRTLLRQDHANSDSLYSVRDYIAKHKIRCKLKLKDWAYVDWIVYPAGRYE